MANFVITNTGNITIKTAGVDLEPGSCRGCPMEHLEKLEIPKGAEYFISYNGDKEPDTIHPETGELIVGKELFSPDILIGKQRLKSGDRTDIIRADEDIALSVDAVELK